MTDPTRLGDVEAALEAATDLVQLIDGTATPEATIVAATRGSEGDTYIGVEDLEGYGPAPLRSHGTVTAQTIGGLLTALHQRAGSPPEGPVVVYADVVDRELVAVLNDDTVKLGPGWRDDRIVYAPQTSPEWDHWVRHQGLGAQAKFAEVLEEGEDDIVDPSATVMLELAQTFHASTSARFRQAGRLRDGRTQLVYEEEVEATAGEGGLIDIPERFTVRVSPFLGLDPVDVVCRLRYRIHKGELTIGYRIVRPDAILADAFDRIVAVVAEHAAVVEGRPAMPREPAR